MYLCWFCFIVPFLGVTTWLFLQDEDEDEDDDDDDNSNSFNDTRQSTRSKLALTRDGSSSILREAMEVLLLLLLVDNLAR
mmetsp:Transcript_58852/g.63526  ORF Transcript_58852/g.63526 Transcript_58852/m.63526 type:complete len:80 (+) Transcript_58852:269-508(+)